MTFPTKLGVLPVALGPLIIIRDLRYSSDYPTPNLVVSLVWMLMSFILIVQIGSINFGLLESHSVYYITH